MKIVYSTDVLKARMKNDKLKYWKGHIGFENDIHYTFSSYWHDTNSGTSVVQQSDPYEVKTVNVGKSNQKGGFDQALSIISSDLNNQICKGYFIDKESEVPLLPMLANRYVEGKNKFPMIAQAKIDGMRAIWKDGVFTSRLGKVILPEVTEHIKPTGNLILDGELCLPLEYGFQDTMRAVKKKCDLSSKLMYYVFDIVDASRSIEDRIDLILQNYLLYKEDSKDYSYGILKSTVPGVVIVNSFNVKTHEEMIDSHNSFVENGYEGIILRKYGSGYEIGKRSLGLLKYKEFLDSEFKVIGVREGEGNEKGLALFQCETEDGFLFDCRPRGTEEYRRELWLNKKSYIGKRLTIRYQKPLLDTKIPRFPVGVGFREDVE